MPWNQKIPSSCGELQMTQDSHTSIHHNKEIRQVLKNKKDKLQNQRAAERKGSINQNKAAIFIRQAVDELSVVGRPHVPDVLTWHRYVLSVHRFCLNDGSLFYGLL
jgi:hypothetical protein